MKILTPLKAIRANCLECCCDSAHEVRLCPTKNCPLHPYRFGKNPYLSGRKLTPEHKAVALKNLKKGMPHPL
jgi:hypothetical protein